MKKEVPEIIIRKAALEEWAAALIPFHHNLEKRARSEKSTL